MCTSCTTPLTVRHIITDCPSLQQYRQDLNLPLDTKTCLNDLKMCYKVIQLLKKQIYMTKYKTNNYILQ